MRKKLFVGVISLSMALPAMAEQPQDFLATFAAEARQDNPAFAGFKAGRGRQLFNSPHGGEWSCSTCHTDNPAATGQHAVTQKTIEPLAPSSNPERFSNRAKVEKWFKRNCKDVLKRECTALEKGDVLTYLMTVQH